VLPVGDEQQFLKRFVGAAASLLSIPWKPCALFLW
jgi:hypothetical protein